MALPELMGFADAGILLAAFALLLVVLSYNVSQINSLMIFANAKAFVTALSTRLVTSPNCFAYEQQMPYYNQQGYSGIPANSVDIQSSETPGVISFSKFITNNFLSCAQYTYYGGATDVPFSKTLIPDMVGISVTLTDTQDPTGLAGQRSLTLSNFPQYEYGSAFVSAEEATAMEAEVVEAVLFVESVAINVAIGVLTAGASYASGINVNLIGVLGSNSHNSIAPQYVLSYLLLSENRYTES
ncbi:MAG: hypothetical protein RAK22_02820, partial [Nanoarchaeota archaeon]|nr:hypothetical protein [Nanoarchaeota archaeon]